MNRYEVTNKDGDVQYITAKYFLADDYGVVGFYVEYEPARLFLSNGKDELIALLQTWDSIIKVEEDE